MKKISFACIALLSLASCQSLIEEWQPVATLRYKDVPAEETVTMTRTHSIAELAAMYTPGEGNDNEVKLGPVKGKDIIIAGRVSTSDQAGNFYKSLYIQDETGGIELKLGKNGLYNDYKPGQWIYVNCSGLYLGMYGWKARNTTYNSNGNGMIQLGLDDPSNSYETSYIEENRFISEHFFKGEVVLDSEDAPVTPKVVASSALPSWNDTQATNPNVGRLVTLKNLSYGAQVFTLLYVDSNKDKKASSNRVFIADGVHGITSWALSMNKFRTMLDTGVWDSIKLGNAGDYNYGTVADHKDEIRKNAAALSVSQYFNMEDGTEIQIRTSGFSKFGDYEIPADVIAGRKIDVTGILSLYQGSIQFTVNSYEDFRYSDNGKTLPKKQ